MTTVHIFFDYINKGITLLNLIFFQKFKVGTLLHVLKPALEIIVWNVCLPCQTPPTLRSMFLNKILLVHPSPAFPKPSSPPSLKINYKIHYLTIRLNCF